MEQLPVLNFPPADLRIRRHDDGRDYIPDIIRGGYLLLTPEEWVRRHLIAFLLGYCGVELRSMATEFPAPLNGTAQRADLVIVEPSGQPLLLAECKAPDVAIDKGVFAQAVRYNSVLHARYIILTNGLRHYCYERHGDDYLPLREFPKFMQIDDV